MLDSLDTLIAFALIFTVVSLLITILVQMVTSLCNLRGKNLAWGIAETFEAIAPGLEAKAGIGAKSLADHLLKDDLLSDSQIWKWTFKSNAVRADELYALLHRIVTGKKLGTPDTIKNDVVTLFKGLGVPDYVFEAGEAQKKKLEGLKADLSTKLATLPDGPAKEKLLGEINKIETWLKQTANEAEGAAILWAAQGEAKIQEIYQKFEHWFETGQERSQEWFTTHARIITAILGLLFAFVLQLDTIEIYKLVSSNRAVRDNLVAQTKNVIEQGEKVFKDQNQPSVLHSALSQIRSTNAFLTNVSINVGDTVGAVRAKIQAAAPTNRSPEAVNKLLANFDQQTHNIVTNNLANYQAEYTNVSTLVDKTGFDLFPKDGGRWQKEGDWTLANRRIWMSHVFGMLFSALLLSLGAPFWFNTLKSLASLRSSVAKNISEEDKAELKNTKAAQASKLPPTVT